MCFTRSLVRHASPRAMMIRAIVQKKMLVFVQFCCACGVVVCTAASSMLDLQDSKNS